MQNCIQCHIICDKCKKNETISSATPSVAGFHHSWLGMMMSKAATNKSKTSMQFVAFKCMHCNGEYARPSLPLKECWNPVSGSKQPSFTNIQRTSRPINGNITPTSSFHSWSVLANLIWMDAFHSSWMCLNLCNKKVNNINYSQCLVTWYEWMRFIRLECAWISVLVSAYQVGINACVSFLFNVFQFLK